MGQAYGTANKGPSAPPLMSSMAEKENNKLLLSQSATRIEALVRLIICSHNPFIQCRGEEVVVVGPQAPIPNSKLYGAGSSSGANGNYSGCYGGGSSAKPSFQVLFDRCCALTAIEGETLDEIIPDALEFAYDCKNFPLVFDGAFTLKFGKIAQVRPRSVDLEHGMESTVVFHLNSHKDHKELQQQSRTANLLETVRDDFKMS